MRLDGGSTLGHPYPSVDTTVQMWRTLDRCGGPKHDQTPTDADSAIPGAETTRSWWGPCAGGSAVGMWIAHGSGHAFPITYGFTESLLGWLYAHPRKTA